MKLEWLFFFREVAKTNSVTKASQNLYMSQPALSKIIQQLEKETDVALLARTPSGVKLTEQGEILLHFSEEVLRIYDDYLVAKSNCHQQTAMVEGVVELAISPLLLQTYYQLIMKKTKQYFPKIDLRFIEADMTGAEQVLLDSACAFGFMLYDRSLQLALDEPIVIEEVYASELLICASRNSRYAGMKNLSFWDIPSDKLISIVFSKKSPGTPSGDYNCYTTNLEVALEKLLSDDEVCILLPRCIAERKFLNSGRFICITEQGQAMSSVYFMYNQSSLNNAVYPNSFLKDFRRALTQCIMY